MPIRTKYDFERLHKYCDEKSVLLLDDYSSSQLKKTFIIKGKCIYNGCQDTFEKNFINLLKHGAYCKKCIKIVSVEKMKKTFLQNYGSENILHLDFVKDKTNPNKFTNDKLINYCKEHNIKLLNDYSNDKLTKKSKIKATCQTLNCNSIVDKIFREIEKRGVYCEICSQQNKQNKRKATCLQKYGVENAISSKDVQTKTKLTNLKKYGVEYTFQSEIVKDKIKKICIEKYGVENASQNKDVREKYKQTCLEKYGVEHISQTDNYKKKYKTTIMTKFGVEHISQNESIKKKKIDTCLKNYGVEYPSQHSDIKQKQIDTCLKNYGVKYPSQHAYIKQKTINTCLKKYGVEYLFQSEQVKHKIKEAHLNNLGVEYPSQSEIVKNKIKENCLSTYGVEHPQQRQEIKNKTKQTNMKKYGVEYVLQLNDIKIQSKKTCMQKYGCEHPLQNSTIMDKFIKSSYSKKEYIFPSGKIDHVQGYENFALNELIINEKIDESDIIIGSQNVPEIWYHTDDGVKHRYYVDIYIPSQNKCIEVKSLYTYKINEKINLLKEEATKKLGYNYEFWIYNNKGQKI